ncbi:MAG: glyoxalase [Solirubrobacteraceae bacterium]
MKDLRAVADGRQEPTSQLALAESELGGERLDTLGRVEQAHDRCLNRAVRWAKHVGVWPLTQVAQACFGTSEWPAARTVPDASIEFEVTDPEAVSVAGEELHAAGYELLHPAREEPWGQTVARMLSPEGLIIGISHAPWLHG